MIAVRFDLAALSAWLKGRSSRIALVKSFHCACHAVNFSFGASQAIPPSPAETHLEEGQKSYFHFCADKSPKDRGEASKS